MKLQSRALFMVLLLVVPFAQVMADEYSDTIKVFRDAGESGTFFARSYGYAVFPTIGKGGIGIGGAYGKGRVYEQGNYVGDTSVTQLSIGLQLGGQAYSQIVFFEDNEFTSGNFEFGAQASAVAITAGASAEATTTGSSAGASGGKHDATTVGKYYKGMAVFTVAKGGLMYEASIGGQKFSYTPID
jgi:lipid-binding SYLF domain-containing protein